MCRKLYICGGKRLKHSSSSSSSTLNLDALTTFLNWKQRFKSTLGCFTNRQIFKVAAKGSSVGSEHLTTAFNSQLSQGVSLRGLQAHLQSTDLTEK